ncbi:prolyl-tRNA editing enzyme YbaK/EbsC (Cys-tRNA(Pro) deacylase) [Paenibacillus anaericanus]|uniref:aminoacyl-tRNA deacylase n=1 Tax=Paenibacillus anaericanus TaxID=170367 RepID=UPI00278A32A4|nr:YbaK/EbsC family protein [Paenibacillus anaericanus]MDQ0088512.1 prolyl-tRNA editing enzyme YbaK/EbsC (Cys-tRNA(Pro) deacylase) [Paenibacillus anaericanus]
MDKLTSILEEQDIEYEILEHREQINTAQEGADYFGIDIGQTAPTLILKTEKGFYALIVSGDYGRVNLDTIKELISVEQVKLASPKEVEQVTSSKIGSVSLVNPGIPTILDNQLNRYAFVYGGTGIPQTTLKIRPSDLERVNEIEGYIG